MFTNLTVATDSQLNENQIANLLVEDALHKMSLLTDLNQQQCIELITAQLSMPTQKKAVKNQSPPTPILEQQETLFIRKLFH